MTTIGFADPRRRRGVVHTSAVYFTIVSGTVALFAILLGSPLQFGLSLALCGAGWIATHFAELYAESDQRPTGLAAGRRANAQRLYRHRASPFS